MIVYPTVDSWVNEASPATNYGSKPKLWTNGGGGSDDRMAYIHFSAVGSIFPAGATIISATLKVYLAGAWSGSQTMTAKRVTGAKWTESGLTWTNKPSATATNQATKSVTDGADQDEATFDVTNMMQAVADGGAWYGIQISLSANVSRALYSSDYADSALHPVIEIEWSEAPEAPTNLYPANDSAVSIDAPVLSWTFTDKAGNTQQASSQVQVNSTDDFSSPDYDSTKVSNTESSWDLDGETTIGAGDTAYWRVKVWDGTDIASEWSEPVSFVRTAQGSLALDYPSGATVPTVTPTIAWTLTGATQEAYEVILYRVEDNLSLTKLYRTKTTSTDDEFQIPAGNIVSGKNYEVVVRTWDDVDRATTPGDPDYLEQSADFSYDRDGTPDPVETLTVTGDSAAVVLEWTITVEPDFFSLRVDGEEVMPRIDPEDVLVSGTTYRMSYWAAVPRTSYNYEVEAVVIDSAVHKHSDGNPDEDFATRPVGITLVDPDDGLDVFIAGKQSAGFALGESGTTYTLVGARSPVRITDSIRGYEGDVSGTLLDQQARDDFIELKERLKELRLILGDLNIPVWLEEVAVVPLPNPGEFMYSVAMRVFQSDEFIESATARPGVLGWSD